MKLLSVLLLNEITARPCRSHQLFQYPKTLNRSSIQLNYCRELIVLQDEINRLENEQNHYIGQVRYGDMQRDCIIIDLTIDSVVATATNYSVPTLLLNSLLTRFNQYGPDVPNLVLTRQPFGWRCSPGEYDTGTCVQICCTEWHGSECIYCPLMVTTNNDCSAQ